MKVMCLLGFFSSVIGLMLLFGDNDSLGYLFTTFSILVGAMVNFLDTKKQDKPNEYFGDHEMIIFFKSFSHNLETNHFLVSDVTEFKNHAKEKKTTDRIDLSFYYEKKFYSVFIYKDFCSVCFESTQVLSIFKNKTLINIDNGWFKNLRGLHLKLIRPILQGQIKRRAIGPIGKNDISNQ